jgi:hypothetical protein
MARNDGNGGRSRRGAINPKYARPDDIDSGLWPGKRAPTDSLPPVMRRVAPNGLGGNNGVSDGADAALGSAASSSGSALPTPIQRKFERSLGADLSGVRVHTGSASADAAASVSARAYTVGQDVHFGAGQYDPSTAAGEHLVAHEVAHTVQQSGGAVGRKAQPKLEVTTPGDHFEVEADRAADAMVAGAPASVSGGSGLARQVVQRKEGEGEGGEKKGAAFKGAISLPVLKIPKEPMGYFEASGWVKYTVEAEEAEKEGEGEHPGEVKLTNEMLEVECKKKLYEGKSVTVEGTFGDAVNWKEKKFELGATGVKLKAGNDEIETDLGGKFIPFTIDDEGVHIGAVQFSGKGAPKEKPTISVAGHTVQLTPMLNWQIELELNKEKVAEALFKRVLWTLGDGTVGGALIPMAIIANGVLTVFMFVDTFLAADDIHNLVEAGPGATDKARAFIAQTAADLKAGKGAAIDKIQEKISQEFGGKLPAGLLVKALGERSSVEELKKTMWPPMRQQIIEQSVAKYRSKHTVESGFHDATSWIGEHIFGAKDDHHSTYGDDIVRTTLEETLPTSL